MKLSSLLTLLFASNMAPIVQHVARSHEQGNMDDNEALEALKESKLSKLESTECPHLAKVLGIKHVQYALPTQAELANTSLPSGEVSILRPTEVSFEDAYAEGDDVILDPLEV